MVPVDGSRSKLPGVEEGEGLGEGWVIGEVVVVAVVIIVLGGGMEASG